MTLNKLFEDSVTILTNASAMNWVSEKILAETEGEAWRQDLARIS